jgi:uncharacterized membrane protein HdeD (DUF308 family)
MNKNDMILGGVLIIAGVILIITSPKVPQFPSSICDEPTTHDSCVSTVKATLQAAQEGDFYTKVIAGILIIAGAVVLYWSYSKKHKK